MEPMLDADQQDYQSGLRTFLTRNWDGDRVRASMDGPHELERETWRRLAAELGVAGLGIPEEHGGSGGAPAEALIASEELGAVLLGAFHLSSVVMAANAVQLSGDAAAAERLLPGIADGTVTAALAYAEDGRDRTAPGAPVARRADDGWRISGEVRRVIDGSTADEVLVVADGPEGPSLFVLDDLAAVRRTAVETLDPTRRMSTLAMADVAATPVGPAGDATRVLDRLRPLVAMHVAAEAVGGAATCIARTVAHVSTREQFGRPIGSFQAVKHRCADMQLRLEGARAGVRVAGQALANGDAGTDRLASVVKLYATQSYFRTAADTIQLHGGIGFTWEHEAHLHFKRAKSLELIGGSRREHRDLIARDVLDARPAAGIAG